MKLQKSLSIYMLMFAIIPLLFFSLLSSFVSRNQIINNEKEYIEILAYTNGMALNDILKGQDREVQLMARNRQISSFVQRKNNNDETEIKVNENIVGILNNWLSNNPYYTKAIISDKNGVVISGDKANYIGNDVSHEDFFVSSINNPNKTYTKDYLNKSEKEGMPIFTSSVAIKSVEGDVIGVLTLFVDVKFFDSFINNIQFNDTGSTYILNGDGDMILHTDKSLVGTTSPWLSERLNGMQTSEMPDDSSGTITYIHQGVEYFGSYYVISETGWVLTCREATKELLSPVNKLYILAFLFLAFSTIFAFLLSKKMSVKFTEPILVLNDAFSKAADDKTYVSCNIEEDNEFGDLANSYNKMIDTLNLNYEELLDTYKNIEEKEKENYELAYKDRLTGLPNRINLIRQLNTLIESGEKGGVVYIDIDNFKNINDVLGHNIGDILLIEFAKRLKLIDPTALCSRISGDEFIMVVCGNNTHLDFMARNIIANIAEPFYVDGTTLSISSSLGIASFTKKTDSCEAIIRNADMAMVAAKAAGKNTYYFYCDSMQSKIIRENHILEVVKSCIYKNEIYALYQPEVDFATNEILGFETLMRIDNTDHGFLGPAEFIPVAESSGFISALGYWVLERACLFTKQLLSEGKSCSFMSVNVSYVQIIDVDFVEKVINVLKKVDLEPKYLQIEVTESLLMQNLEDSITKLSELREYGITVALDDFGTSFSSLNYLINLPIDVIKIDKSFIDDICTIGKKQIVVKTIIDMSHMLGLRVVAEGVETKEQREMLVSMNCDIMQGYYYSKPIKENEVIEMYNAQNN